MHFESLLVVIYFLLIKGKHKEGTAVKIKGSEANLIFILKNAGMEAMKQVEFLLQSHFLVKKKKYEALKEL